jgi:hypothetical protein
MRRARRSTSLAFEDHSVPVPSVTVKLTEHLYAKRYRATLTFNLPDRNLLFIDMALVRRDQAGITRVIMPGIRRGEGYASTVRLPMSWYAAAVEAATRALDEAEQ